MKCTAESLDLWKSKMQKKNKVRKLSSSTNPLFAMQIEIYFQYKKFGWNYLSVHFARFMKKKSTTKFKCYNHFVEFKLTKRLNQKNITTFQKDTILYTKCELIYETQVLNVFWYSQSHLTYICDKGSNFRLVGEIPAYFASTINSAYKMFRHFSSWKWTKKGWK